MSTQIELAKNRLFDKNSLNVRNIKFFPGTNRDVTAEQMAEQINKALSQMATGDFEEIKDVD